MPNSESLSEISSRYAKKECMHEISRRGFKNFQKVVCNFTKYTKDKSFNGKVVLNQILKIQRKFKCRLQQARKKLEKQKLLSIVLKKIRTNLGKIRYYFKSWIDKKDIIKQIKALLIIKRALKKNKVLSIHRRKTFSLFNDFSEKIRNFFKMHLISIMYTIDSNQYKLNKANLFLNKIKFFHIYRTLHLLCSSSVRQNRLVSLYQFYDRKHCSSSMEKYFSKWRDQLRKEVKLV